MMKRIFLTVIVTCGMASAMAGSPSYVNNGTVTGSPVIDATNFVNYGNFLVSGYALPFDFSNTRNFTNYNYMSGSPGFRFDTAFPSTGQRIMAANFYNAGLGSSTANASVTASSQLLISATNVVSRGSLTVGSSGLLSIQGKKVDVARGILTASDSSTGQLFTDLYWGIGTNRINPTVNAAAAAPTTPAHQVISGSGGFYFTNRANVLTLMDFGLSTNSSLLATQLVSELGSNRVVQIVFVRNNAFDPNTNLHVAINFVGGSPTELAELVVEWSAVGVNAAGLPATNFLYLTDTFGVNPTNAFITNRVSGVTYQPQNFSLYLSSFQQTFNSNPAATGYTDPAAAFWGTPLTTTNLYSAWSVGISGANFDTSDPTQARLAAGRIEINGDKILDLNLARITVNTYLNIQGTNQFNGASNAQISALYSDVNVGSTNGQLRIANLLSPSVPRISGTVSLYSAVWTNDVVFSGSTNPVAFNILYVDSDLTTELDAQQLAVGIRSTNVVLNDTLNVVESFDLNAENLTIADTGAINLQSLEDQNWAVNAPRLKNLTNSGSIYAPNDLDFSARNSAGGEVPYHSIVNSGVIGAAGVSVAANNIVNVGGIWAQYGQIFLHGLNVDLRDSGYLYGPYADVVIEAANLTVSNHYIWPGRGISLSITNSLVSGPNFWTVYAGFNLWQKPATGDLLETEIYDVGYEFAEVLHTWAGADLGPTAAGFTNNAALGALDLDGGELTLFTFSGAGPGDNALYVDVLYLLNSATNRDVDGNLIALNLTPGMKLYFAQAFIDDGFGGLTDITTELAGKNGGAIVQVAHTGPVSLPKAPMTSINPALKVKVELTPTRRSLLTWDTTALATNYLYCIGHPGDTNWQVVTNFVSGPTGGPVTVADPLLHNSRFYKVRVDVPAQ